MMKILMIVIVIILMISISNAESDIVTIKTFLKQDTTNNHQYIMPNYVCVQFAYDLARNASEYNITMGGAILGTNSEFKGLKNHMMNYVYINGSIYLIEPQNDQIFKLQSGFKYKYIKLIPEWVKINQTYRGIKPDITWKDY